MLRWILQPVTTTDKDARRRKRTLSVGNVPRRESPLSYRNTRVISPAFLASPRWRPFVLVEGVGIDIQRGGGLAVAEDARHRCHIRAACDHQTMQKATTTFNNRKS